MDDRNFDQQSALEWVETIEGTGSRVRETDVYPRLRDWVDRADATDILDIGCGQGVCSAALNLVGRRYTGVDASPFLVERAIQLHADQNKRFVLGNAYALPFANGRFDAAFSIAVWHLLEDKLKAARELSRVLTDGGHFLICAAHPDAYDEWVETYASSKREGVRCEGRVVKNDGSASTDILYLHSYDDIVASLQAAQLDIEETSAFRTVILIRGRRNTAARL